MNKEKPPVGGQPTDGNNRKNRFNNNQQQHFTTPLDCCLAPNPSNVRLNADVDRLQAHAEEMMERDPARYPDHWAIWTSLHFLACGWFWPGGER